MSSVSLIHWHISSRALQPVSDDLELQAQLARFLCVLGSGFIEQSVIQIVGKYAAEKSHSRVGRYVESQLSRFQNGKFEDILMLLGRFDPLWRDHFENSVPAEVKDAIDSIVNNRNQIAHGKQTGISIVTFSEYYASVKRFLTDLDLFLR